MFQSSAVWFHPASFESRSACDTHLASSAVGLSESIGDESITFLPMGANDTPIVILLTFAA